jgi:hypothetical protein
MKSLFNKIIIILANITLLTLGTKGSITDARCQSMLAGLKTGCTLGLPSPGVLLLEKTGDINSYNQKRIYSTGSKLSVLSSNDISLNP